MNLKETKFEVLLFALSAGPFLIDKIWPTTIGSLNAGYYIMTLSVGAMILIYKMFIDMRIGFIIILLIALFNAIVGSIIIFVELDLLTPTYENVRPYLLMLAFYVILDVELIIAIYYKIVRRISG